MTGDQRGVALVSVLLIVAVATALAYGMVERQTLSVAHSKQTLAGSQARQYALGGEQYARQILFADWEEVETRELDTLFEQWAAPTETFEIAGGAIEIRIQDLDRRFNLNAVAGRRGPQNAARLKRLLTHLEIDPNAADAWVDWIDEDQDVTAFGLEDSARLMDDPPRRTANQRAVHVSEFVVATGIDAAAFARLRPHVTVLPVLDLRINVNTANEVVLGTLAPNFPAASALAMVELDREFPRIEEVTAAYAQLGEAAGVLAVVSEYFRVQVRAEVDDARAETTAVIHRNVETGEQALLWRSFGDPFEARAWHEDDEEAGDQVEPALSANPPRRAQARYTMRRPERRIKPRTA